MNSIAKVTSKGQITLPKEVRKELRLREGSLVLFEKEDDKIILKPARTLKDFKGYLRGKKPLMEFHEIREQAKKYIRKKVTQNDEK